MNKSIAIIIISLVSFAIACVVFRYWIDTRVISAEACMHNEETTATLEYKTMVGGCYWRVTGDRLVSEHWFNCDNNVTGEAVSWVRPNYSCDHLLKTYESLP